MKYRVWQLICGCLGVIACALFIGTVSGDAGQAAQAAESLDDNLMFNLAEQQRTLEAIADIGESLQRLQSLDADTLRRLARLESSHSLQRVIGLLVDESTQAHPLPHQIGAKQILFARPDDSATGRAGQIMIDWHRQVLALRSGEKAVTSTGSISLLGVEALGSNQARVKITLATEAGNREIYFPN